MCTSCNCTCQKEFKLEVGKIYVCRDGKRTMILTDKCKVDGVCRHAGLNVDVNNDLTPNSTYLKWYEPNGRLGGASANHPADLVSEYKEPEYSYVVVFGDKSMNRYVTQDEAEKGLPGNRLWKFLLKINMVDGTSTVLKKNS